MLSTWRRLRCWPLTPKKTRRKASWLCLVRWRSCLLKRCLELTNQRKLFSRSLPNDAVTWNPKCLRTLVMCHKAIPLCQRPSQPRSPRIWLQQRIYTKSILDLARTRSLSRISQRSKDSHPKCRPLEPTLLRIDLDFCDDPRCNQLALKRNPLKSKTILLKTLLLAYQSSAKQRIGQVEHLRFQMLWPNRLSYTMITPLGQRHPTEEAVLLRLTQSQPKT